MNKKELKENQLIKITINLSHSWIDKEVIRNKEKEVLRNKEKNEDLIINQMEWTYNKCKKISQIMDIRNYIHKTKKLVF